MVDLTDFIHPDEAPARPDEECKRLEDKCAAMASVIEQQNADICEIAKEKREKLKRIESLEAELDASDTRTLGAEVCAEIARAREQYDSNVRKLRALTEEIQQSLARQNLLDAVEAEKKRGDKRVIEAQTCLMDKLKSFLGLQEPIAVWDWAHAEIMCIVITDYERRGFCVGTEEPFNDYGHPRGTTDIYAFKESLMEVAEIKTAITKVDETIRQVHNAERVLLKCMNGRMKGITDVRSRLVIEDTPFNRQVLSKYDKIFRRENVWVCDRVAKTLKKWNWSKMDVME